jgi:hypothetical protein
MNVDKKEAVGVSYNFIWLVVLCTFFTALFCVRYAFIAPKPIDPPFNIISLETSFLESFFKDQAEEKKQTCP